MNGSSFADRAVEPKSPSPSQSRSLSLDLSRLTHLVGFASTRAAVEMKKSFRENLGPLQLKTVEFSILVIVAANDQVSQKQLCLALDMSPPNMAVTLDRLAERGWIERVRSTEDRRSQIVVLTETGHAVVEKAERIARTMEDETLQVLSPAERLLLLELLLKVVRGRPVVRA